MHWLSKMNKTPIGAKFLVASYNCSAKPLSGVISNVFKLTFNHVKIFHRKNLFHT